MPTNKEVVDLIEQWSGKRPGKMSQNLEEWWNQTAPGSTHSALPFNQNGVKDGTDDLVKRIQQAFPSSPVVVSGDFQASGTIKTVQDLVDALQPVATDSALSGSAEEDVVAVRGVPARQKTKRKVTSQRRELRKRKKARVGKKSVGQKKSAKKSKKK